MNAFMMLASGIAAIGGFLYGFDTGIISGALLSIADEFKLGQTMQELVASAILLGASTGRFCSGGISDRFGRRATIMTIAAIFAAGAVGAALAPNAILLAAARVFLGLAVGGSSQEVPTLHCRAGAAGTARQPGDRLQPGDRDRHRFCRKFRKRTR